MTRIYCIPNCSTVKNARAWLAEHNIAAEFTDFKKQAPAAELLQSWLAQVPLATLINRKGTTWRQLDPQQQAQADNPGDAIALMAAQPSLIKRPVLVHQNQVHVGFNAAQYAAIFNLPSTAA